MRYVIIALLLYLSVVYGNVFVAHRGNGNGVNSGSLNSILQKPFKVAMYVQFTANNSSSLVKTLEEWLPACNDPKETAHMTDLVFYSTAQNNVENEENIRNALSSNINDVISCFNDISFQHHPVMRVDSIVEMSNYPFSYLYKHHGRFISEYNYIFWADADTLPIRSNWLDHIIYLTKYTDNDFWVKGSSNVFVAIEQDDIHHISRNAIYCGPNNPLFTLFYEMLSTTFELFPKEPFEKALLNVIPKLVQMEGENNEWREASFDQKFRRNIFEFRERYIRDPYIVELNHPDIIWYTDEVISRFIDAFFIHGKKAGDKRVNIIPIKTHPSDILVKEETAEVDKNPNNTNKKKKKKKMKIIPNINIGNEINLGKDNGQESNNNDNSIKTMQNVAPKIDNPIQVFPPLNEDNDIHNKIYPPIPLPP